MKKLLKKTVFYRLYLKRKFNLLRAENIRLKEVSRAPLFDKFLPKNGIGAELGVLKGELSRILLAKTSAKELHLVDPWYFLAPHWEWSDGNTSTVDAVVAILIDFKKEIESKKVFVHIQDDIAVLESFPDNYFDWIYIDSSHQYLHTLMELEICNRKIKEDGIICGDDWRTDKNHRHHGVCKAVMEFIAKENYQVLYSSDVDLQWFIKKQ
jgi:hypothetical protein